MRIVMCRVLLVVVLSVVLTAAAARAAEEPLPPGPGSPAPKEALQAEALSPHGQTIRLWDVQTGKEVKPGSQAQGQTPDNQYPRIVELLKQAQNLQAQIKSGGGSNQEVVDLLKKAVQLLEARNPMPVPQPQAVRIINVPVKTTYLSQPKESPELERARSEVKAAEQRLQEAKDRLAKLQTAPKTAAVKLYWQQFEARPADRTAELEKRIDRLIQEVEAIRQEIKKSPPK